MTWGENDYPWPDAPCGQTNQHLCGYAYRNCTDFMCWRLRHDLGLPCFYWGSALTWASKAREQGFLVDHSPRVHDVMQLMPGEQGSNPRFGHVCGVLEVGPSEHAAAGHVWCEGYDWDPICGYGMVQFAVTSRTWFIHVTPVPTPTPHPTPTPTPAPAEDDGMLAFELEPKGDPSGHDLIELPGMRAGSSIHLASQDRTGASGEVVLVFCADGGEPESNHTFELTGTVAGQHGPVTGNIATATLAGTAEGTVTFMNLSAARVWVTVTVP